MQVIADGGGHVAELFNTWFWVRNGKRVEKSAADSIKLDLQRQSKGLIFMVLQWPSLSWEVSFLKKLKNDRTPCLQFYIPLIFYLVKYLHFAGVKPRWLMG